VNDLSIDEFKPSEFKDTYREKVLRIAEQKAAGQEVAVSAALRTPK
jgi:non-homologous end joining protein Ku